MIENLPDFISISFAIITIVTLYFFYDILKKPNSENIRNKSNLILFGLFIWLIIQGILTLKNIYNSDGNSIPPKILIFGIAPPIFTIMLLFITKNGRDFIDSLDLAKITYLNIVRIPVEIVLFYLSVYNLIPELMTFEGRNYDILAGISAPFIAYYGIKTQKLSRNGILIWNFICLGLLINIIINALLSTPSPFQKFAFEQPNIAILNFPFSWLPTFIVPIIIFGHLVSIRKLTKK
ncbi:hypothetical protein [Flavobacterium crassostreae]|uniref:hypothetical protein n=1 Tax=Flavobacterium crassostreae TaxID=1763534 RepID=UPI0008A5E3AF|nr:hypothetical protein [Flavobacterium crassostreae]